MSRTAGNLGEIKRRRILTWAKVRVVFKFWRSKRFRRRTRIKRVDAVAYGAFAFNLNTLALNAAGENFCTLIPEPGNSVRGEGGPNLDPEQPWSVPGNSETGILYNRIERPYP